MKKTSLVFISIFIILTANAQSGTIDESFGNKGSVFTNMEMTLSYNIGLNMLVLENNKIVVAGANSFDTIFLICYNEDGTLDKNFGKNGIVKTYIFGENKISGINLDSDNKILVAYTNYGNSSPKPVLIKYNLDGTRDQNYGIKMLNYYSPTNQAIFQKDGKIIFGGMIRNVTTDWDFWFIRFNNDGTIDNSFGKNGSIIIDLGDSVPDEFSKMLVLDNGKILACGSSISKNRRYQISTILKLNNNGSIDSTFGINGKVLNEFNYNYVVNNFGYNIHSQPNGKIILIGAFKDEFSDGNNFFTIRYNSNGSIDSTFGETGIGYVVDSFLNHSTDFALSIVKQSDGKLIVAGQNDVALGNTYCVMIRYSSDGYLDESFGTDGKVIASISPTGTDLFSSMALLPNGKILINSVDRNNEIAVSRFINDKKLNIEIEIKKQEVTIFPNPATTKLTIASETAIKEIYIYNLLGKLVKQMNLVNNKTKKTETTIDELSAGIYIIQVIDDFDAKLSSKFIKE